MIYNIVVKLVKAFSLFYFKKIEIKGVENIPKEGGAIICVNHSSFWDPVILECFLPRPVCFMAKQELEKTFFVGWVLKSIGTIFVKRSTSDMAAIKASIKALQLGKLFGIFPTGTRSKVNPDAKPQMGVAFIAVKSEAPVIPVHIISEFKMFSKLTVSIGEPIKLEPYGNEKLTKKDYEKMSINVYQNLLKLK